MVRHLRCAVWAAREVKHHEKPVRLDEGDGVRQGPRLHLGGSLNHAEEVDIGPPRMGCPWA